jgi:hypothetical protein
MLDLPDPVENTRVYRILGRVYRIQSIQDFGENTRVYRILGRVYRILG